MLSNNKRYHMEDIIIFHWMLHRVRTINLTERRISLDICGQGRLSGGGGHKLALKGGKIGGRRGHF